MLNEDECSLVHFAHLKWREWVRDGEALQSVAKFNGGIVDVESP
jgi:hypothetical protein